MAVLRNGAVESPDFVVHLFSVRQMQSATGVYDSDEPAIVIQSGMPWTTRIDDFMPPCYTDTANWAVLKGNTFIAA